ncbi:hypothetical protein [Luteibacter jiangsuensis]
MDFLHAGKGHVGGRWRSAVNATLAILVLWIVNFATFRKHYQAKTTFPWDFLGGYHAQAFGWYDMGSLIAPPTWFPWTNLGFPAFLAIQASGWYLPLAVLHALGFVYNVHAATMIQVLHVLLGAIGAFALARRLGAGVLVALIAGLAYHYQAAFFSNQQHVDIVRASAWFPWLLFVLHPKTFVRGWWGPLLCAFVLSQLLISAYPGAIVAFAYTGTVWALMLVWSLEETHERWRYVVLLAVSVAGGTLMSMPKWMPFLLNGSADITTEGLQAMPVPPSSLLTLLMPYHTKAFTGDPTMRAIWLPLVAMWGAAFASPRDRVVRLGFGLLVLGLVFCFLAPRAPALVRYLPGIGLSRFPMADWRPAISVGIILIGVAGWQSLYARPWSTGQVGVRTTVAVCLCLIVAIHAIRFGFEAPSLTLLLGFSAAAAAVTVLGHACWTRHDAPPALRTLTFVLLVFATALNGYWYQLSQPLTWRPIWNKAVEVQSFGGRFKDFMKARHPAIATDRRPARTLLGKDLKTVIGFRNSSHYNQCWYMHTYCVFGYDNLKMSVPHAKLLSAVSAPDGEALLEFVSRPQQLLVLADGRGDSIPALQESDADAPVVGGGDGVSTEFVTYAPGVVTYRVATARPIRIVENEIGWHGWKMSRCDAHDACTAPSDVAMTSQGLRTWDVPPGSWTIKLHFDAPSTVPGYLSFFIGLLLACAAGLWVRHRGLRVVR